jgi:DNA-binding response OmpR family regulator
MLKKEWSTKRVNGVSNSTTPGKSRTVLVVEDEEFIRDLIKKKLETKGYTVLTAETAEDGREILHRTPVDLICLDILLPVQDGFSFLEELKANEQFKHIPVFILSNLGQQAEIDRGMALGAADYIIKANAAPGEIAARVGALLER